MIWLLYLEMFQPLSLSYSRKPEPECSVQKMAAKCTNAFSPLMLQALSVKLLKLSIALFAKLLLLELLVFIHLGYQHLNAVLSLLHGLTNHCCQSCGIDALFKEICLLFSGSRNGKAVI